MLIISSIKVILLRWDMQRFRLPSGAVEAENALVS